MISAFKNVNSFNKSNNNVYFSANTVTLADLKNISQTISPDELKQLKLETEVLAKKYPLDHQYRVELAKEAGCDVALLRSVVGVQELSDILKNSKHENFSVGAKSSNLKEKYKNILNGTFNVNLHSHTRYSDGALTVEQSLEQASRYANKTGKPFTLAITDHDCLKGSQEAIRLIAANPKKYKNVRFVPGIEFSALYKNPSLLKEPLAVDFMGYCINPFDKNLNAMLDKTIKSRLKYGNEIINTAKNSWGIDVNLFQVYSLNSFPGKGISTGYFKALQQYIGLKLKQNGQYEKNESQFKKVFADKNALTTPEMSEVIKTVKDSKYGELGVVHPGRINFANKLITDLPDTNNDDKYLQVMQQFLRDNSSRGVKMAEVNYQYDPSKYPKSIKNPEKWIQDINAYCKKLGFIEAGGKDCHTNNIFSFKENLPDIQINELTGN